MMMLAGMFFLGVICAVISLLLLYWLFGTSLGWLPFLPFIVVVIVSIAIWCVFTIGPTTLAVIVAYVSGILVTFLFVRHVDA